MNKSMNMTFRRQQGFTLLEVLIAMLVLGVAVMGFAGLQVRSLQSTGVAHMRSQAMTLAADAVERIRANSSALAIYTTAANWGSGTYPATAPSTWGNPTSCIYTASAIGPGCTDVQMAQFDAKEIQYTAQQLLPNGTASVRNCPNTTLVVCVFIAWSGVDAGTCVDNTTANCVSMQVVAQ